MIFLSSFFEARDLMTFDRAVGRNPGQASRPAEYVKFRQLEGQVVDDLRTMPDRVSGWLP